MPNVTILHESQEWETEFESVTEVRVDGQKLNDIHDLTKKVDKITKIIKVLAITATCLTVIAVSGVSYIGSWLAINKDEIASAMDATQDSRKRIENMVEHRFNKLFGYQAKVSNIAHSRKNLSDRLYELTGNMWVRDQWIVDPKWQQNANTPSSPSIQDD